MAAQSSPHVERDLVAIRFVIILLGGHKQVALENAALRQQLAVFKRDVNVRGCFGGTGCFG
jgi:hypothetical protein